MNEEYMNEEELQESLPDSENGAELAGQPPGEAQSEIEAVSVEETQAADVTEAAPDEEAEKKQKPKGRVIFSLFITLFCGLVICLSVYGFIVPDRDFSENESRLLAQLPDITVSGVLDGSFMRKFESYLTDQFPLRDGAIYVKSIIERALGKKSENGAYIGKNGFLFEKQTPYDEKRMQNIAKSINGFTGANKSINTVFALVPNSSFVYAEHLPAFLETENQRQQIEHFYSLLGDGTDTVDAVTALLEEKSGHQIFYKSDHHWTTRGAFAVFGNIMEKFGDKVDREDFEFYTVSNSFEGTLSSKCPAVRAVDSVEVCFPENSQGTYFAEFSDEGNKRESLFFKEKLEQKNHYEVFLGSNCAKVGISTVVEGDRKLLVIKDSFANCMIPMLTPYFSKIVVVDPRYMTEGIDGIMKEEVFTDILFLYNANTFFDDTVLTDVLGY